MKKAFAVAISVGLLVGSLAMPAEAGKKKKKKAPPAPQKVERVVETVYQAPAIGSATAGGACLAATSSCGRAATGPDDQYVKVSVADATGTPTAFTLGQDSDPDALGTETKYGVFCGTTGDTPVKLEALGAEVLTFVWAFGDIVCPGAVGTTGTVTITLSNLP